MAKEMESSDLAEVNRDREFVRSNWSKIKQYKGKAVVVSEGRLQGVFSTYEKARFFASKKRKIALVFIVNRLPKKREIELGVEMETSKEQTSGS